MMSKASCLAWIAASAAMTVQAATPCTDTSNSVERISLAKGVLSGRIDMPWGKNSMCISADSLTLKSDFVLMMRGRELEIAVKGKLVAEPGAMVTAYDYPVEFAESLARKVSIPDGPLNPPPIASYSTGPGTTGNPGGGAGRRGGNARNAHVTGNGHPGLDGGTPKPIRIHSGQSAEGILRVLASGTNGARGYKGAPATAAGNGEQGAEGQKDNLGLCSDGPGAGGNGGNGGIGASAGNGGDGGSGGYVALNMPTSPKFSVEVDLGAGEGGIAGLPGVSTAGGRPGCGGEKGPGLCTPVVWSSQGFYGNTAPSHPAGYAGQPGTSGSIDALNIKVTRIDQPRQACKPFSPPTEADRIPLDRLQQMALLGALAQQVFGSPARPGEGPNSVQFIDVQSRGSWLSAIDLQRVQQYTNFPPPAATPFPSGCTNVECCPKSPTLACLTGAPWQFLSSSPKTRYLVARQGWLDVFKKVISIEVAKNSRYSTEADLSEASEDGQTWLKWSPSMDRSLFTLMDDDLLARLALIFASAQSQMRDVLYLRASSSSEVMVCSADAVHATAMPASLSGTGYAEVRTGPLKAIQLHGQATPLYFSLPAYYHGDETMFGRPSLTATPPTIAGYENTQYCEMASRIKASAFYRPFSCAPSEGRLNDLVVKGDRDIDFPGALSILFSLRFIQAAIAELPPDIPAYVTAKLYCPATLVDKD